MSDLTDLPKQLRESGESETRNCRVVLKSTIADTINYIKVLEQQNEALSEDREQAVCKAVALQAANEELREENERLKEGDTANLKRALDLLAKLEQSEANLTMKVQELEGEIQEIHQAYIDMGSTAP
jgi:FtsZ-binding cell division protein ZapB